MKKIEFPSDFLWGGAVSAEQTEGKGTTRKGKTIYDLQFEENPKSFYEGVGPGITSDFLAHYKDDIKMWKEFGLNSHRTSMSWARIFPDGDYTKPNKEAVKFYHDFIDEMIKNDIKPIITLYHFDSPDYIYNQGEWQNRNTWDQYLEYAKFVFHEYSDKVKLWTTMNEPFVPALLSFGTDQKRRLPKVRDAQKYVDSSYGIVMAHAKVVNYFNENIKKQFSAEIGGIFNSPIVYPRDANNPEDVKAAEYSTLFCFTGITDSMVDGIWNKKLVEWVKEMNLLPTNYVKGDVEELGKVQTDFVGLNFYSPSRAKAPTNKNSDWIFDRYFENYNLPGRRENKFRGWEIYPEAVYDTLTEMLKRYGKDKKYMLTEYGMGVEGEDKFRDAKTGIINDNYRGAFIMEHLEELARFMSDNKDVKVLGAHMWATIDCWSWDNAYKNRYGYFEVDLKTQERKPKASAYLMRDIINNNGFESGYKKMEEYMDYDNMTFHASKN